MHGSPATLLIQACVCGLPIRQRAIEPRGEGIPIQRCPCGVAVLATYQTANDIAEWYRGEYHASCDRHPGCQPYLSRYDHDCEVADLRIEAYRENFGESFDSVETALDVGSANGAFVDSLRAIGVEAWGLDPDVAMVGEHVLTGTLPADALQDPRWSEMGHFDLVTLHDVLEHVVDPKAMIAAAVDLLTVDGLLVVDVPDVSVPEGHHHYKYEHLWYFTPSSLLKLLDEAGLVLSDSYKPIAGKLVVGGVKR